MKKVLSYAGIVSCVLALVSFILLMATPAISYTVDVPLVGKTTTTISGIAGIFGGTDYEYSLPWAGLVSWILVLVAFILCIVTVVLPMLKVETLKKYSNIMNIVAAVMLIMAGFFTFLEVVAFEGANELFSKGNLGVGWIISGILLIVGGIFALLPTVMALIEKNK